MNLVMRETAPKHRKKLGDQLGFQSKTSHSLSETKLTQTPPTRLSLLTLTQRDQANSDSPHETKLI